VKELELDLPKAMQLVSELSLELAQQPPRIVDSY
jgi:hypothetical protein